MTANIRWISMSQHHDFLHPLCSPSTLDIYLSRHKILNSLTEQLGNLHGTLLDVGCGRMPYKSILLAPPSRVEKYIGLDLRADLRGKPYQKFGAPDLEWDGSIIPLDAEAVDCAIATEVFEQCTDVETLMRETLRVLRPGGLLFFTVPFLWPLHDAPYDQYRFTPFALERHLRNAGFEHIQMKALGGWDSSLAQMIGLWVRRRKMGQWKRRMLSRLALPIVRFLIKRDSPQPVFKDQTMITGISGIAQKPAR